MKQANPLYVINHSVLPELVLAVRMLTLFLILTNTWFQVATFDFSGYNPVTELRRLFKSPYFLQYGLVMAGAATILFSGWIRSGAFLIGATMLAANLLCRQCTSVAHLFTSCVFLITSFSNHVTGSSLLRYQLVVLYLFALLNKVIDPDWWNGHTMETMLVKEHELAAYTSLTALFPDLFISKVLGINVMLFQLMIAAFLILPGMTRSAMLIALLLHIPMTIMTGLIFAPFLPALLVSFTALSGWRKQIIIPQSAPFQKSGLLSLLDLNDQIQHNSAEKPAGTPPILSRPSLLRQWVSFPPVLYGFFLITTAIILFNKLWLLCIFIITMFVVAEAPNLLRELKNIQLFLRKQATKV